MEEYVFDKRLFCWEVLFDFLNFFKLDEEEIRNLICGVY